MRKKYFRYKAENLINVKNIVTVHDFRLKKDFISERESHDFWELVYVEKGKIFYTRNEKTGELRAGEILFHKPDVSHSLSGDGVTDSHVIIVSFDCKSDAMKYFEDFTAKLSDKLKKYLSEIIEIGGEFFDLASTLPETKKMPKKENPPLGGLQILKNTLELFLIYLLQSETAKTNPSAIFLPHLPDKKSLAESVKDILSANVYNNLSIEEICEKTYYSRSYLFREFKKATKISVMAYFGTLKIEEAKRLLTSTQSSVAEIASALSYDTPEYFSKRFKKTTGTTPLSYRKRALR